MNQRLATFRDWAGAARTITLTSFYPLLMSAAMSLMVGANAAQASPPGNGWAGISIPSNEEAWRLLPAAETGGNQPLPIWARALAKSLPQTTAAMLHLDWVQRTQSPLGPRLRGKMRWVAADANRCEYTRATAEADLRRAGIDDEGLKALKGDHSGLPDAERAALSFARKMTLRADTVTDGEVAWLKNHYGDQKLTAMVLLLAYSNFQDRLLLTLGLPLESGGPLEPLEVRFAANATAPTVPPRDKVGTHVGPPVPAFMADPEWTEISFDELQRGLSEQRSNLGRIRTPTWDEVKKGLPVDYPVPKAPIRIKWSLVCLGYQPLLGAAWSAATRTFAKEAQQDMVFEESLFWVVTRTIHCFY